MSKRRFTHRDTGRVPSAEVKVRLLTGKTLSINHPGALPSILLLEADQDSARDARVPCKRTGVDTYEQMTVAEMLKEGLLKPREEESAKAEDGQAAELEDAETAGD